MYLKSEALARVKYYSWSKVHVRMTVLFHVIVFILIIKTMKLSFKFLYHCFSYITILKRSMHIFFNFHRPCVGGNCGQVFLPIWVLPLEQECGIEQR